jgi:hypothetical protein
VRRRAVLRPPEARTVSKPSLSTTRAFSSASLERETISDRGMTLPEKRHHEVLAMPAGHDERRMCSSRIFAARALS